MPALVFRLHIALLALAAIACVSCKVVVPQPPQLTIALKAKARPQAPPPKVEVELATDELELEAAGGGTVDIEVAPPPTGPVALYGAGVVEFFGIPLEGAQDIVFVLDRSGSMEERAQGQIAQISSAQGVYPSTSTLPGAPPAAPPLPDSQALPPARAQEAPSPLPPLQGPRKIDVAHAELIDALGRLPAGTRMNLLYFNNRLEAVEASIVALDEGNRERVIGFVQETFPYGPTALAPAMRTAFLMQAKRIVLLSDGLGNIGGDAQSVLRDAREAIRGGVRIDTVGLGQDQDAWLLGALAGESGGIYQRL